VATVSTPAIVLRSVAYGEADRIVTLLGRSTGRVSALARSARKSVRRFGGGLGLGAAGQATLRERGGELMAFEGFEVSDAHMGLAGDVGRTAHAAYALELCDKLCAQGQAEPAVHDWLDELLRRLEGGAPTAERLRVFELGLLGRLGMGPALSRCLACGRTELGEETTRWVPERGGVLCGGCARTGALLPAAPRRALAQLARMSLAEADAVSLSRDVNAACRRAILDLIRTHVTGPLRSLEFIEKMQAAGG
jgi:DNA repair protein RecO (recombination protein O)